MDIVILLCGLLLEGSMSERVPFRPNRTCECSVFRKGYAGVIVHRRPCELGVEWLAQSGDIIISGQRYRWINGDDQWSRDHGHEEINVVAEVTRVSDIGMVYAYWHNDLPKARQRGYETCIPNSAVVELAK